jgi:hypothetical protein
MKVTGMPSDKPRFKPGDLVTSRLTLLPEGPWLVFSDSGDLQGRFSVVSLPRGCVRYNIELSHNFTHATDTYTVSN